MVSLQLYRDTAGRPAATAAAPHEAVGAFLRLAVGTDAELGDWIVETIDAVVAGREPEAQQITVPPNESSVTIEEQTAEVCCGFGEAVPPEAAAWRLERDRCASFARAVVPTPELRAAVVRWLAFVRGSVPDAEPGAAPDPAGM